ncbi:MAG: heme-copper oxidase subunit III [Deltaproteobacteria bacterium]|nr:heme-copper oxidase subunit III [Deltaproteobacteria bacterium]
MAAPRRLTRTGSVLRVTDTGAHITASPISNARLAMVIFLAFESMFFAALIAAYLVFRLRSAIWPPSDLPQLPLAVTWMNTGVLAISAYTMRRARAAQRAGRRDELARSLVATAALGSLFLAVQGSEWARLVGHGLTLSTGMYGATFYTLIGCHGLHVLAAVVWLLVVLARAQRSRFAAPVRVPLELCAIYWFYVVGLWAALFPLVYLL